MWFKDRSGGRLGTVMNAYTARSDRVRRRPLVDRSARCRGVGRSTANGRKEKLCRRGKTLNCLKTDFLAKPTRLLRLQFKLFARESFTSCMMSVVITLRFPVDVIVFYTGDTNNCTILRWIFYILFAPLMINKYEQIIKRP